jgi:hypothetical protein
MVVDVSGRVDGEEHVLRMGGIAQAFGNSGVIGVI